MTDLDPFYIAALAYLAVGAGFTLLAATRCFPEGRVEPTDGRAGFVTYAVLAIALISVLVEIALFWPWFVRRLL